MATYAAIGYSANQSVGGDPGVGARVLHALYAKVTVATALAASDLIDLGFLPKHAIPVGGYMSLTDIDTGTETLDIDIGITANGVDSADPDFFLNSGVLTGDAIGADLPLTNAANVRLMTGPFPVEQLGAKTKVQAICNAVAQAGGTGTIVVVIYYTMPGKATS